MASLKKEILEKYPNKYFVETGTHIGNSVQLALDCGFEKIITMEINPEKVEHAKERFSKEIEKGRVTILQGDTVETFSKALKLLDDRATFWLDAHWDDGPQGKYLCPLPIELEAIQKTSIKNHTLLIDDRRLFGLSGTTWGHTIDEDGILESIADINKFYKISYENGCVPNDIIVAKVLE
tara:strand:- start:497 stop:1036 length:540 start_codon:yes stop_codon:yes gene_type:complete